MDDNGASYLDRKAFYSRVLTIYGRKSVLECLRDSRLDCHCLHLAASNRQSGIVRELRELAEGRGIPVKEHSREALARISRNGRQDQGVAADIICPAFRSVTDYLSTLDDRKPQRLLALDGVTNPQNAGMIIRSAAAAGVAGLLYPERGTAGLGPLVIKASAGTVYRAPLLRCENLAPALSACREQGFRIYCLDGTGGTSLFTAPPDARAVYVLGSESEGVSKTVRDMADQSLAIPMASGVESLNVAVAAALVAYAAQLGAGYFDR